MSDMHWYDWLRVVTALLAFVCLLSQVNRGRRLWNKLDRRARDFWWAYNMLLFVMFYGSLEAVVVNAPWGPRGVVSFLAVLVTCRALILSYRHDRLKGVPKIF